MQERIAGLRESIRRMNWQNSEEVNSVLRSLFYVRHEGNNEIYVKLLNEIQELYSQEVRSHFGYRMDGRTLGQFGSDIYDGHLLERRIANWWLPLFAHHHFGNVHGKCVGIDDSGSLLLQTGDKSEMKRPDYLLEPTNIYLEIKSNPCDWKYTPKVADIEHYVSLNAYVLAVCSRGKFEEHGTNCKCYFLISPEQSKKMLEEGTVIKGRKESGGKPAIQFHMNLHEESVYNKKRFGDLDKSAMSLENLGILVHPVRVV